MMCPKCKSENVSVQIVNEVKLKTKHRGLFYWLFIGWWWELIKWFFFTIPALIIAIFKPRKQKVINKQKTMCICQGCGYSWKA